MIKTYKQIILYCIFFLKMMRFLYGSFDVGIQVPQRKIHYYCCCCLHRTHDEGRFKRRFIINIYPSIIQRKPIHTHIGHKAHCYDRNAPVVNQKHVEKLLQFCSEYKQFVFIFDYFYFTHTHVQYVDFKSRCQTTTCEHATDICMFFTTVEVSLMHIHII